MGEFFGGLFSPLSLFSLALIFTGGFTILYAAEDVRSRPLALIVGIVLLAEAVALR